MRNDATKRATAMPGRPGKATTVATITTGLMAGAASRKVRAAAGATPRDTSRPATGTDEHSHPGRRAPAAPATGTANAVRVGTTCCSQVLGTRVDTAALSTTPSTRKGSACRVSDTNTVAQLCTGAIDVSRPAAPR